MYDFVIIGSGLGGLECGVILSKAGYSVLILEKNRQIGGNLQTFARDKRIFDTGVHYIGGLEPGQNLYHYFKYLGIMDDLRIQKMEEGGFDVISFEGDENEYLHAQGYERFIEVLSEQFPKERKNIEKYCRDIRKVCSRVPMYNLLPYDNTSLTSDHHEIGIKTFIESCTDNPKLQKVLAGNNMLYAGEGDKTPLYVHAMIINSYIESSYRCVDGGSQIARLLAKMIKSHGGKIIRNAEVKSFEISQGNIKSAVLASGEKVEGRNFISNVHPDATLDMIDPGMIRKSYRSRIKNLPNSISTFITYLSIKRNMLPYFNHNYYHFLNDDIWNGTKYDSWPSVLGIFTSPTSRSPQFADTITIMTYMNYCEMEKWSGTFNTVSQGDYRGAEYEDFKNSKSEQLIEHLERRLPGTKQAIHAHYAATPLTYRDYLGTKEGSIYGITKDYNNPLLSFMAPRSRIPNLYFTGQNLNLHGVLGVTIGSVVTCSAFLDNKQLMHDIRQS